ncbi:MAG TPA: ABC transporter permease, partial [Puia sp.]|nr:ABC transporter permease [Puia sp.]
MIKTYFKIAWRNLMKNKTFSFINIFGLSVGLACCMLIGLYIVNELSYDKYQENANVLYQLGTTFKLQGDEKNLPNTPAAMGETMK